MKLDIAVLAFSLVTSVTAGVINEPQSIARTDAIVHSDEHDLYKRRGGGGGGGGRGGGGGGGSRGGSSSGGGRGGGSGSSRGGSSTPGNTRTNSNTGGTSASGSGAPRSFGGGQFYGGGARTPYRAGGNSPSNIVPFALGGAALGLWAGGVHHAGYYGYPHHDEYEFHNASSGKDEKKPVICGCAKDEVCGCDDKDDKKVLKDLIGDGTYSKLNKSLVNVAEYKGRSTIFINGSLPNGTTSASAAGPGMSTMGAALGVWPVIIAVLASVYVA